MKSHLVTLQATPLNGSALLHFPALDDIAGFAHAVTTRPWNMAPYRGPEADRAVERRRLICGHLGLPFEHLTVPDQIHSPHVIRVLPGDVGAGREGRHDALRYVDGLTCDMPGVPLLQHSADCPLIVAVDPQRRVFGTAHASWRGTVTRITEELIRQLRVNYLADPARLVAGVCPCAGPEEYEVGPDVMRIAFSRLDDAERFFRGREGRLYLDLRAANVDQLVASGLRPENIHVADASTMSDPRFYSHRRDGAETGRFGLIAGFRAESA